MIWKEITHAYVFICMNMIKGFVYVKEIYISNVTKNKMSFSFMKHLLRA